MLIYQRVLFTVYTLGNNKLIMVLCQKEINIITDTTNLEIWDKTDQICKLLVKHGLNYSTLDISDTDDANVIKKNIKLENNKLPTLPSFTIDGAVIGDITKLYSLSQSKEIVTMTRYFK